MPETVIYPERRERHCRPCPHHKMMNAFYGSDHSWQDYNCMHPDAHDDREPLADPEKEKIRQRLIGAMAKEGRHIGRTERQPDWCPLRREPPANAKDQP